MDSYIGFRGSLFGGFNRKDVSQYIERLAAERNTLKAEAERCTKELNETNAQNSMLALRLGEAQLIAGDAKTRLEELEQQVEESRKESEQAQKSMEAAMQLANEAADSDKALRDEKTALSAALSAAEEKAAALEERISALEKELEAANYRAEEAERTAKCLRVTAVSEAIETLTALGTQCSSTAQEAEAIASRANSEFWKVTAAMDELCTKMRDAGERFMDLSKELKAENEE